jgi:ABC-type transport system substrate-binding protein
MSAPGPTRRGVLVGAGALAALPARAAPRPLTYGLSTYPPNLRPFDYTGAAAQTVKVLIHRGLLMFGPDGKVHPELAASLATPDPRTYVFTLRDNAVFHDGTPVTAADVQFSLAQIVAPRSTAYFKSYFQVVDRVEATAPKVVTITLKQPTASFAAMLASPHCPIVSAKSDLANPDQVIGAGPFILAEAERGVGLTFKANRAFYKPGLPKSDAVRFTVYADDNVRAAALVAGDVDIIEYVPWQSMKTIGNDPHLALQSGMAVYMYLVFNLANGPFTDARVRQAVACAVNRADIVKGAFYGNGEPLDGLPIDPGSPFFDPASAHLWPFDPDRARALLREAGAPNLAVTLLGTSTYGMHADTAQIIQQNLAAIGVQVTLSLPEWGARVALGNQGRYQFAVNGGGGEFGDPDELTALIGSGAASYRRSAGLADPTLDAILAKARSETDEASRRADYAELSRHVATTVPICTLNYRTQAYGLRREVRDFQCLPGLLLNDSGSAFDTAWRA